MKSYLHEGRTVAVTGSGRGLGVEIARRFVREGAKVLLCDVNSEGLADVQAELLDEGPGEVLTLQQDLSVQAGGKALVAAAVNAWGRLDILVNNAGGGHIRPFLSHDQQSLRETFERNIWTTLWCCHAAIPQMQSQQYGRIVNVGAESVHNGLASHAGYNAAKGGVEGLTTGLAREFALDGITVNTVSPGGLLTPEVKQMLQPDSELYKKHDIPDIRQFTRPIPMQRFAEMEEVASMINYIASEEARFVTGQVIGVNGGNTMGK